MTEDTAAEADRRVWRVQHRDYQPLETPTSSFSGASYRKLPETLAKAELARYSNPDA